MRDRSWPRFRSTIGIAEQVSFGVYDHPFLDPEDQDPALPAGQALVMYRAGANPDLKTQNADTLTLGSTSPRTFVPGLTIKADYYRIEISDRIGTPSPGNSLAVRDLQIFNTHFDRPWRRCAPFSTTRRSSSKRVRRGSVDQRRGPDLFGSAGEFPPVSCRRCS